MKYIKFLGNSKYLVPENWNVSNYKYYSFTKTLPDESTTTGIYKTRGLIRNGKQEIIITKEGGVSKKEYAFIDSKSNIYDTSGNKIGTVVSEAYLDPANGHKYVEIGGIKWATMNIGANSVTDAGLYFQWGDIQGYTADQIGSGEGKKYFDPEWSDYKYADISDPEEAVMTKYCENDEKKTLDVEDDAVAVAWGGAWRMPTTEEYQSLIEATNQSYTEDYNGTGIHGLIFTDKTNNSKILFFPEAGFGKEGEILITDNGYWTSSVYEDEEYYDSHHYENARHLGFYKSYYVGGNSSYYRFRGFPVRGVLDYQEEQETPPTPSVNNNGHEYVDLGLPSGTLWATMNVGATSPTEYGNYYMYGMGSKTYDSTDTPYNGTEDPLDLSKDTARQVWGGDWHMPTEELMLELIDNTTQEWTDSFGPGVAGVAFTGTNGNIIFMPACGYYENNTLQGTADYGNVWSSNCFEDSNNADLLYFFVDGSGLTKCYTTNEYRYYGYSVRPVIG